MKFSEYIEPGGWDYDNSRSLSAAGGVCGHCGHVMMKAFAYQELKTAVMTGQLSQEAMDEACMGYCLGHYGEWIPEYVITESKE